MRERPTILLVDDDEGVRVTLEAILEREGYAVTAAAGGAEALAQLSGEGGAGFDLVLTDLNLGGASTEDGMAVVAAARRRDPHAVVMVLTGYASVGNAVRALREGVHDFLVKPCDVGELKAAVARGVERRQLMRQARTADEALRDASEQRRAAQRAAALAEASRVFAASGLELGEVIDAVVRQVAEVVGETAVLSLLSEDAGHLEVASLYHPDAEQRRFHRELAERVRLPVGAGVAGRVAQTGEAFWTNEPAELARWTGTSERFRRLAERYPVLGAACVPLRVGGRVLGTLTAMRHGAAGRPYDEEDVGLLRELADRAALAVQNARLLEEARAARRRAEEAVRQRDTFIAVAAHELRTPLTTLRGYTHMAQREVEAALRGEGRGERLRRAWEMVDRESRRIERLVWSLLDLSSVETGGLTLNRTETPLAELAAMAERVVAAGRGRSEIHRILARLPDGGEGASALVDGIRVEQVLENLLDNAIKYSPQGGEIEVRVEVARLKEDWNGGENGEDRDGGLPEDGADTERGERAVRLCVRDQGPGISPERVKEVFRPFARGELSGVPGLGLGLYVCRQIVELHGGRIRLACPDDGGTLVEVLLPLGGGGALP